MANRLLYENSLYLRKHGHNPVDWYPWGKEAHQLALELDRPILLSIGYSSCHWCTVMEQEAFSDQGIADYLNRYFVAIKVDREERPDLDSIYMQALQLMQDQGGWPLNMFLTPDLIPFYGGTYFPVEARYGRPGFQEILAFLHTFYKQKKEEVQTRQQRLMDALSGVTRLGVGKSIQKTWLRPAIPQVRTVLERTGGTAFPMIPYADFLVQVGRWQELGLQTTTHQRGLHLALGGIFDHVGGGFHRYTTDSQWTVPHFEKMLYDNGQIMGYLAHLWQRGDHEPSFERGVALTVAWLDREMTATEGYFYGSQDADSDGAEGKFYVWTLEELATFLDSAELALLTQNFTLTPEGNFVDHHQPNPLPGQNVLKRHSNGAFTAVLTAVLTKLFAYRQQRVFPVTDTKMILSWNGLMVSGLVHAALAFDRPEYGVRAIRCVDFLLQQAWQAGQLQRIYQAGQAAVAATAEDYAYFVRALLDVYHLNQEAAYLQAAQRVQAQMDEVLWDNELGGYWNSTADELILREKEYQDNSTPSANGISAQNLLRLFALTDKVAYLQRAERTLLAFAQVIETAPRACPSLLSAVDLYWNLSLVQVFDPARLRALQMTYHPTTVYQLVAQPEDTEGAIALVCKGTTCLPPARSDEELARLLSEVTARVF